MRKIFGLEFRVWSASILNALFLAFGLYTLVATHDTRGVSLPMYLGFLYVQATYVEAGYKTKKWGMFWGMIASAVIVITIIVTTLVYRGGHL